MATESTIDVDYTAKSITASNASRDRVEGTLEELEYEEILEAIGIDNILTYFGDEKVLDAITRETARQHFGFEE